MPAKHFPHGPFFLVDMQHPMPLQIPDDEKTKSFFPSVATTAVVLIIITSILAIINIKEKKGERKPSINQKILIKDL